MRNRVSGLAGLALLLAGCGGDTDGDRPDPTSGAAVSDGQGAMPSPDCRPVSSGTARRLASGDNEPPIIAPIFAAAYDAPVPVRRTFFIAMEFDSPGAEGSVGVWAMDGKGGRPAPPVYAVDEVAREFTVWPDGVAAGLLNVDNGEVGQALNCLDELR